MSKPGVDAGRRTTPSGTTPSRTNRHKAITGIDYYVYERVRGFLARRHKIKGSWLLSPKATILDLS